MTHEATPFQRDWVGQETGLYFEPVAAIALTPLCVRRVSFEAYKEFESFSSFFRQSPVYMYII